MIKTNDKYRVYWLQKSTGSHGMEYTDNKREDFETKVKMVKKINALFKDPDVVVDSIEWIGLSQEYIVRWFEFDSAYIRVRVDVEDSTVRNQVKSIADISRILKNKEGRK
jgi:hypothetical protein